jgi:uncharacterized repeat protein (TIGR03847 family)
MTRRIFIFDPPDRFVAGAVGMPGRRTFYLQARAGDRIISVSLEKVQVAVLAERLDRLLDELERRGLVEATTESAEAVSGPPPLDEPLNEAFRAGTLTLGWDPEDERILIEARELRPEDEGEAEEAEEAVEWRDDDPTGPDVLRVRISPPAARAFVAGAAAVVAAGRPPCPLCGAPLDPTGHLCPRRNGQRLN